MMKVHELFATEAREPMASTTPRARVGGTALACVVVLMVSGIARGQDVEYESASGSGDVQLVNHCDTCDRCRPQRKRCGKKHCQRCHPQRSYSDIETDEPSQNGEAEDPDTTTRQVEPDFDPFDSTSGLASTFGASSGPQSAAPLMIGDFSGQGYNLDFPNTNGYVLVTPPPPSTPTNSTVIHNGELRFTNPFVTRTFKIGENESAVPQDRVFGRYNFFDHLGGSDSELSRYVVGFEKTFFDGRASFGMAVPFYSVNPGSNAALPTAGPNGTPVGTFGGSPGQESDIGDITVVFKYALFSDRQNGRIFTSGLAVTTPTGPKTLGDVEPVFHTDVNHDGTIQPFLGFLCLSPGGFFVQGFTSVDVPFDGNDATLWFNDLGIGCYRRRPGASWLTAVIPTVELHHNSPLNNHLMSFRPTSAFQSQFGAVPLIGQAEYVDQLNLTAGLTLGLFGQTTLGFGFVTPLVGPNPFDYELQVQLNVFPAIFGRSVGGSGPVVPFL